MQRLLSFVTLVVLLGLGWVFASNFKIEGLTKKDAPTAGDTSQTTWDGTFPTAAPPGTLPPATPPPTVAHDGKQTIRVASFNIQVFGESKASKPHVMRVLADVVRQFDVVAIQEIRTKRGEYLMRDFVAQINARYKRHFQYVIGPRLGRTSSKEQYAYVFDAASVEADLAGAYSISDPADALHREPLVVQFRVRGPPREQAFTFTLVNIHTDPDEAAEEVDVMADVYRVVRQASRGEDDVIILGDFNASDRQLGRLGQIPDIYPVIQGKATNTRQNKTYDNLVLHRPSTVEFTGRAGVLDIMRAYNLSTDQALDVSDHLPVWAEFGLYESAGPNGRVATQPRNDWGW